MVKNLPANAGDAQDGGLIPGSGRSHGIGNGNPLQYSCVENSMNRGACQATVHGVTRVGHLATKPSPLKHRQSIYILCCSVTKLCPTLQPHGLQQPGSSVLHYPLEFAQIHAY